MSISHLVVDLDPSLPSLSADLKLAFSYGQNTSYTAELDNITLNFGCFFSTVLAPILIASTRC